MISCDVEGIKYAMQVWYKIFHSGTAIDDDASRNELETLEDSMTTEEEVIYGNILDNFQEQASVVDDQDVADLFNDYLEKVHLYRVRFDDLQK